MKAIILTLVLGLIVCASAQDQRRLGNPNFQFVNATIAGKFVQCERTWFGAPSAEDPLDTTGYRITARAQSFCEINNKPLRASLFAAGAGSKPGPSFWARTLVKQFKTSTTATILGFEAFLAFDRFGTYSTIQNGTFDAAKLDWFVPLFSANTTLFTNITITKTVITGSSGGDNNSVYTLSFSSLPNIFVNHPNLVLNFILDVTPVVTQFGIKILTPDSFKLTVAASGIDYVNMSTPGGAYLGVWLLTGKAIGTITTGNTSTNLDAPGIPSTTNGNLNITDNTTDPDQGFFSFDLKAWGDGPNKDVDVVYVRSVSEDNTFSGLNAFTQYTARRIHFATTVKSLTVEWDPALGASESTNDAGSLLPSFSLLLVALIALLL